MIEKNGFTDPPPMETKILKRPILTALLFIVIGLAFYVTWKRELFQGTTQHLQPIEAPDRKGPVYSLQPIVVELAGTYIQVIPAEDGGNPRLGTRKKYLGMTVVLELTDKDAMDILQQKQDQIIPAITGVAASKKVKDIETAEGRAALGKEIAEKLNESFQKPCVSGVLFKDFMIE